MSTESQHTQTVISISVPCYAGHRSYHQQRKRPVKKRNESTLCYEAIIIPHPSSIAAGKIAIATDLPSNHPGFVVSIYVHRISERTSRIRQLQIKVTFKPMRTLNSLFPRSKAQEKVDRPQSGTAYKMSRTDCTLYATVKLNDHWKLGLQNTKKIFSCSTMTPTISCNVQ